MLQSLGLLLWLAFTSARAAGGQSKQGQAKALLSLKAAVAADTAGVLSSWTDAGVLCTSWQGVSCTQGQVVAIDLPRMGLSGTLPPDLANVKTLQQINLPGNKLFGTLPARWKALANLERLNLESNRLTGTLPAVWTSLDTLQSLSLAGNQLSGTLPVEWGGMAQLVQLNLAQNNLTGQLPASWGRLNLLTQLKLSRNQFTGPLPGQWVRMRALVQLDLAGNRLDGMLPPNWQGLTQLTALDLSRNSLAGQLPRSWGNLGSLQVVSLRSNQLTGRIPSSWNRLAPRIYRVDLAENSGMCGQMLDSLNRATGPAQRNSTKLGQKCEWQADAMALLDFKLAVTADPNNVLAGWQAESNPCGTPGWQGISCTDGRVTGVDLAGSKLTGVPLDLLGRLPKLRSAQLSGNQAAGGILPTSWSALLQLESVSLGYAGLVGELPEAWSRLRALQELSLQGNKLTGMLPASWENMQGLRFLNLGHNNLNGSLPGSWSSMSSLQEAVLQYNKLSGPVPGPWTDLLSMAVLDLEGNTGICGGQPHWQAGVEVRVSNTNILQSCLVASASGTVVGIIVGTAIGGLVACVSAIAALVAYSRHQRRRLRLLQDEHTGRQTAAVLSSPEKLVEDKLAAMGLRNCDTSRAKLLVTLPNGLSSEQEYIKVAAQTPGPDATYRSSSPPRPGIEAHEHSSPSPTGRPGMGSPERHQWQVAAYAQEHGVDLVPRRQQRRLFRSKSEAAQQAAVDMV